MTVFEQQLLADFEWCVASSELIELPINFFQQVDRTEFLKPLLELISNQPEQVISKLSDSLGLLKTKRLGDRFEQFWFTAFDIHPNYQILTRNFAIRDKGRTLGELDLVIQDLTGRCFHLELSCKFYLSYVVGNQIYWFGPGLADRLDKKVNRIIQHQLPIGHHPIAVQKVADIVGFPVDEFEKNYSSHSILRGRCYQPINNIVEQEYASVEDIEPNNAVTNNLWGTSNEWLKFMANQNDMDEMCRWRFLDKVEWFAKVIPKGNEVTAEQFFNRTIDYPKAIVAFNGQDEFLRGFWVEDDWREKATGSIK
ncbi:MAG: DUF1853 family protein [Kangiellaceae bacterium]|jgi:hypothetical protein|nr:DUF1853 family protein [Kangiellaceae bacterium]